MTDKINCFMYDVDNDKIYINSFEYQEKWGYIYVNNESYLKADIEVNNIIEWGCKGDEFIYFYTFIDNTDKALKIIQRFIEGQYVSARDNYKRLSKIRNNFNKTRIHFTNTTGKSVGS